MVVAIEFDVTFEVVDEGVEILSVRIEFFHHRQEHVWNEVFPAKRKCCGYFVQAVASDDFKSATHKVCCCGRGVGMGQGFRNRFALPQCFNNAVDALVRCAGFVHGTFV